MANDTEYATVLEAARALGIEQSVIRRRLASGVMKGTKPSKRLWLIKKTELSKWTSNPHLPKGPKPKARAAKVAGVRGRPRKVK